MLQYHRDIASANFPEIREPRVVPVRMERWLQPASLHRSGRVGERIALLRSIIGPVGETLTVLVVARDAHPP